MQISQNDKLLSVQLGANGESDDLADKVLTPSLQGCQREVDTWQRILQLRSLVLSPSQDTETWIDFADLCRQSDRLNLAEKTLTALVGNAYNAQDREVSFEVHFR